jgi:prepilin signal peptidase PulO-like enzyme (type II secretory pathway)
MSAFFYTLLLALGVSFGSFVNALVWRTRERLPLFIRARSMCPQCRTQIFWHDNIPVISFVVLRGHCRSCRAPIALSYPATEAAVGALFLIAGAFHRVGAFGFTPELVRDLMLVVLLATVFLYDLRYREILDRFTLAPAAALFAAALFFGWDSAGSMAIGASVGGGFFLVQYLVSRGRWIGGGDIRLGAFMGVILGWPLILVALFVSYVLGAAVSILLLLLKKKTLADETPFGTYLTIGTIAAMFWGDRLWSWYTGFLF